jgi:hypothetical protein
MAELSDFTPEETARHQEWLERWQETRRANPGVPAEHEAEAYFAVAAGVWTTLMPGYAHAARRPLVMATMTAKVARDRGELDGDRDDVLLSLLQDDGESPPPASSRH